MANKDNVKREIAKQFDLPERQSKIATLLRQTDVYCICRSTDSTRFMIACDYCEEWYHGDCINITESESRYIKQYFCPPCMEKNPSLEIEYKKAKPSVSSSVKSKTKSSDKKTHEKKAGRPKKSSDYKSSEGQTREYSPKEVFGCGSCQGCLQIVDCLKCDRCTKAQKYGDKKRKLCRKRECLEQKEEGPEEIAMRERHQVLTERQHDVTDEEDDWMPSPTKSRKQKTTPSKRGRKQQRKVLKEAAKQKSRRKKAQKEEEPSTSDSTPSEDSESEDERQCFGLDCINAAKKNSKYCSEDCCVKLATDRLYRILPGRIQEWNLTPSVAEEHNKRDLEAVRRKQLETRNAITALEKKRAELDDHVQTVEKLTVDEDDDEEPEEEGMIHCITCGHEITVKTCLKHMERCYNKYESQTSFGSIYKTKLEGTPIFCDFFNPLNGTYCKRLKVLCPEHSKEPKIRDSEVCGCPLVKNVSELTGEICRLSKKKCNKHFCWEKLRRAEIDMDRVRHWLKLDELLENERQIRLAMSNRGSVMALLLHSTFDHDLRNRIQSQSQMHQEIRSPAEPDNDDDNQMDTLSADDDADFIREPLVKNRDKERRRSTIEKTEKKEELTASKLYKKMVSNKRD